MPIIRQMLCKPSVDALLFFFPSPLKNEAITGRAGKPGLNKVLFPVYLTSLLIKKRESALFVFQKRWPPPLPPPPPEEEPPEYPPPEDPPDDQEPPEDDPP